MNDLCQNTRNSETASKHPAFGERVLETHPIDVFQRGCEQTKNQHTNTYTPARAAMYLSLDNFYGSIPFVKMFKASLENMTHFQL